MPNPLVAQGTLNRLRGSVVFSDSPELNVTAGFLAREAIRLALQGDAGALLGTLTGGVTSPEPYQIAEVTINLVKSAPLADRFKRRIESNVNIGNVVVYTDTDALSAYPLLNCILLGPHDLPFDGNSVSYPVMLRGIYNVNDALWSIT